MDKDSSLLRKFVNYSLKKFNKIGTRSGLRWRRRLDDVRDRLRMEAEAGGT